MEIYQVKIALRNTRPHIWRCVLVPRHFTLGKLHRVLQRAMGWTDSHLHRFVYGRGRHFDLRFALPSKVTAENKTKLGDVLTAPGDRLLYEYDFGTVGSMTFYWNKFFCAKIPSSQSVLQENGHALRKTVEVPTALLSFSTYCGMMILRSTWTDLSGSAMISTLNT